MHFAHELDAQPTTLSRARRIGFVVVAGVALLPMTTAGAQTPPLPSETHCAAGFPLRAITEFDPVYQDWLHTVVDLNGNGYVCARQQPDAVAAALDANLGLPAGFPVYLAADDAIPG